MYVQFVSYEVYYFVIPKNILNRAITSTDRTIIYDDFVNKISAKNKCFNVWASVFFFVKHSKFGFENLKLQMPIFEINHILTVLLIMFVDRKSKSLLKREMFQHEQLR